MVIRESVASPTPITARDLSLTSPPNWTAAIFFAILCALHLSIAVPAFYHARWEGYLSFLLASVFAVVSIFSCFARYEMTILPTDKTIRLRTGAGRMRLQRFVPFSDIHAVRLTIGGEGKSADSLLEVLCDNEDIECPATVIPRQQALYLAVLMGVQLIKVSGDDVSDREF